MKISQVGAQLYTVRDHLKGSFAFTRTIERLKAIGYSAVELVHSDTVSDQEIAKICGDAAVTVAAAHVPGKSIIENPRGVVEKLENVGSKIAVYAFPAGVDFSSRPEVERLARRAALLDSSDPMVTTARAAAMSLSWQCQEAHSLAVRAVAMDPTSTWAWERRGFTGLCGGEHPDKVIGRYTRALQLRGPGWPQVVSFMGMAAAHRSAGRLQEAEDWARKVLAENPDMASTHRWEARYAFDIGDRARMAKAVERMRRLHPDASVSLLVACDPRADLHWLDAMAGAGLPL